MTEYLLNNRPEAIGEEPIVDITSTDGVKYILGDDSWLLVRPSGTEPVLRVYAEGRSPQMVREMMTYGQQIAASIV